MKFRNTCLMLGSLLALAACKPADTNSTTTPAGGEATTQAPAALKEATLICREIRGTDDMSPLAEVSVKIGDQSTIVDSVMVCQTLTPGENDIPKTAVAACGGWWAGGGDYLYLVYEGDDAVVMAGWQDEGQEDVGYHYKELRRISRK